MGKRRTPSKLVPAEIADDAYEVVLTDVSDLLESARRAAARSVNAVMTASYWAVGRRIVEFEQGGEDRAAYGTRLIARLAVDLTRRFGRGYGPVNLAQMRRSYLTWPNPEIFQTASEKWDRQHPGLPLPRFPLFWSHYVSLLSVERPEARTFYEAEALRCGWTVRQLDRQIGTKFYERTLLSRNKVAMLRKGEKAGPGDVLTPEEEIKDPFILEFLDLKDEYSESDLEEALIRHLETFLLELGNDFTFIGRQRRLRIDDEWYRIDLVFFHRRLRCLILIDLKLNKLTAGDVGQMHLYLNYAREHWTHPDENPPVGLILCTEHRSGMARYALEGLPNKVLASEYRMTLPSEEILAAELARSRRMLEGRGGQKAGRRRNRQGTS
jgi:predicted nuclease of restriction endonuclease-like (RecB) superfamily